MIIKTSVLYELFRHYMIIYTYFLVLVILQKIYTIILLIIL